MLTPMQQIAFTCTCQDLNISAQDCLTLLRMTFGIDILVQMEEVLKATGQTAVTNCCSSQLINDTDFCQECGDHATLVFTV